MDATLRDRAIDQAYREHAPDVYRLAFGVLRDEDDALDATHEAFARAWERWEQYDSHRPLGAWLHGIAVHVALDQLRRRKVRRIGVLELGAATARARRHEPDPADEVTRRALVDEAMAGLPPQTRAVLVLRHYHGYDYAGIAELLGLRSGTVGSILSRAHDAIRGRLDRADGGPPVVTPVRSPRSTRGEAAAGPPEVLP